MNTALAAGVAVSFVWLGMVLAISFLEAPLKFRARGVDLRTGLAIGRLVFRALNTAELVLAAGLAAAVLAARPPVAGWIGAGLAVLALAIQLAVVRPRLTRRSDRILAGQDAPRSASHYSYIALEIVKVAALLATGAALLAAGPA
jgi:hypothetical protein